MDRLTMSPHADSGFTYPGPERYQIVSEGELLWEGDAHQFAALLEGMTWELLPELDADGQEQRRLVSKPFPIKESG